MNELELQKIKKVRNIKSKVFTKKKRKDIINKNYNPLQVNYKVIYESEGSHMKKEEINEKDKFIKLLYKICSDFEVESSQKRVENFLSNNEINI